MRLFSGNNPSRDERTGTRVFVWIVVIFGGGYLMLLLAVVLLQRGMVYHPTRHVFATPPMSYEDVKLTAADGPELAAWFVPAEQAKATVLYCHGNGGNRAHRVDTIAQYHALGLSTLMFDYRGYGGSEGTPSEEGTYLDAEAAWRHLTEDRKLRPGAIIVVGRSLGSAIATRLAAEHSPGALSVEAGFTSAVDLGKRMFPYLPVSRLVRYRYPTLEHIKRVRCPVLVVHSPDDGVIPFEHGQRLFEAACEPKEFVQISGGHMEGFVQPGTAYPAELNRFIAEHIP